MAMVKTGCVGCIAPLAKPGEHCQACKTAPFANLDTDWVCKIGVRNSSRRFGFRSEDKSSETVPIGRDPHGTWFSGLTCVNYVFTRMRLVLRVLLLSEFNPVGLLINTHKYYGVFLACNMLGITLLALAGLTAASSPIPTMEASIYV
jgi:hypothetical protein